MSTMKVATFTDSNNILDPVLTTESDIVLTTESDRVGDVCVLEPFLRCHHCHVIFEYVLQLVQESSDSTGNNFIWCKEYYPQISANILTVDWSTVIYDRSINNYFLYLVSFLQSLIIFMFQLQESVSGLDG